MTNLTEKVLWIIWEYAITLFDCSLSVYFFHNILGTKIKFKKFLPLEAILLSIVISVINYKFNTLFGLFVIPLAYFAFTLIFNNKTVIIKFIWTVYCCIVFYSLDLMYLSGVLALSSHYSSDDVMSSTPIRFMNMIVTRLLISIAIMVTIHRKNNKSNLTNKQIYLQLIIPIMDFFALMFMLPIFFIENINTTALVFSALLIFAINIISFYLFEMISKQNQTIQENNLLLQKEKLESMQYSYTLNSFDNLRKWKHDFKNHLNTIFELANYNNIPELQRYIFEILNRIDSECFLVNTGFAAVDAILNAKVMEAKQQNIKISLDLKLIPLENIAITELCSIIGNLWDNAIEATGMLDTKKRNIKFYTNISNEFFSIHCVNSTVLKKESELFKSEKNSEYHGIGIKQMTSIVERHGGICNFKYTENNGKFIADILFPIDKTGISAISHFIWDNFSDPNSQSLHIEEIDKYSVR